MTTDHSIQTHKQKHKRTPNTSFCNYDPLPDSPYFFIIFLHSRGGRQASRQVKDYVGFLTLDSQQPRILDPALNMRRDI